MPLMLLMFSLGMTFEENDLPRLSKVPECVAFKIRDGKDGVFLQFESFIEPALSLLFISSRIAQSPFKSTLFQSFCFLYLA